MNWKLIFLLSIFGFIMGLGAVFGITTKLEPFLWFIILVVCGFIIAKYVESKYFLHGLFMSILNGVWQTILHALFLNTYNTHNPEMLAKFGDKANSIGMVVLMGPIIGVIAGLFAGLLAVLAHKILVRKSN